MKKFFLNGLLLFSSLYLASFTIDAAVFHLFVKERYEFEVGLFTLDQNRRYGLTPNFKGFLYHRAGKTPVSINSRGFRGPEWRLDRDHTFMLVGDSFTFGTPLAYEDGFVHKTQLKIGNRAEFINLGVPGYGPLHIVEVIRENCRRVSPQHVFYMYYLNDTKDNNINMDYFTVVDGYLAPAFDGEWKPYSTDEIRNKIRERKGGDSWRFLDAAQLKSIRTFLSDRGLHPRQMMEKRVNTDKTRYLQSNNAAHSEENILIAAREILKMKALAESCGARFTMMILTTHAEAFYGVIEPATERLLSVLGKAVEIIDLRRFTRQGVNLTQWYDGHYGEAGTDLASNVLAGYVRGRYPKLQN